MTLCFFYICYYLKAAFGSSCDSHHLLLVVISVLQTDFSTSIDWYINIISVTNPGHELLFTRHQRSLIHHIDFHTTQTVTYHPKTTFPIIHCTDDAHTTDCTDHTQLIFICTLFIRLGLSLCDRRVLFSVYHSPRDSYSTEPT